MSKRVNNKKGKKHGKVFYFNRLFQLEKKGWLEITVDRVTLITRIYLFGKLISARHSFDAAIDSAVAKIKRIGWPTKKSS